MTVRRHPQINDELISAYLDNEVTAEERSIIEAAIASDPAVAWQVDSLRETIQLLQALPPLALPRSFTIEAITANEQAQDPAATAKPAAVAARNRNPVAQRDVEQRTSWWHSLQHFWQGGNLYLRNAATVAFALLIVLFASEQFVAPYQPSVRSVRATIETANAPDVTANRAITAISEAAPEMVVDTATPVATPGITSNSLPAEAAVVAQTGETVQADTSEGSSENVTETPAPTAAKRNMPPPPRIPQEDTETLADGSGGSGEQFAQPEAAASVSSLRIATDVAEAAAPSRIQNSQAASNNQARNAPATTVEVSATTSSLVDSAITATIPVTANVDITVTPPITPSILVTDAEEPQPTLESPIDRKADEVASTTNAPAPWLLWSQMITALVTVVLGGLWWRSRG